MANWDKLAEIKLREKAFKETRAKLELADNIDDYIDAMQNLSIVKLKLDAAKGRLKAAYTPHNRISRCFNELPTGII